MDTPTDMNQPVPPDGQIADEAKVRRGIELLFFAYRDFTGEPDAILADIGFGRAHHRALYFIGRYRGITVSDLLDILQITKQSLSRVLRQLIDDGFVCQERGTQDRRQRLLYLTDTGHSLERTLFERQHKRVAGAYSQAGPEAVQGFFQVLMGITDDHARFEHE